MHSCPQKRPRSRPGSGALLFVLGLVASLATVAGRLFERMRPDADLSLGGLAYVPRAIPCRARKHTVSQMNELVLGLFHPALM